MPTRSMRWLLTSTPSATETCLDRRNSRNDEPAGRRTTSARAGARSSGGLCWLDSQGGVVSGRVAVPAAFQHGATVAGEYGRGACDRLAADVAARLRERDAVHELKRTRLDEHHV